MDLTQLESLETSADGFTLRGGALFGEVPTGYTAGEDWRHVFQTWCRTPDGLPIDIPVVFDLGLGVVRIAGQFFLTETGWTLADRDVEMPALEIALDYAEYVGLLTGRVPLRELVMQGACKGAFSQLSLFTFCLRCESWQDWIGIRAGALEQSVIEVEAITATWSVEDLEGDVDGSAI